MSILKDFYEDNKNKKNKITDLEKKQLGTFNDMIDRYCESIGVRMTIKMLIEDYEYTQPELLEMRFDAEDIDSVLEDISLEEV